MFGKILQNVSLLKIQLDGQVNAILARTFIHRNKRSERTNQSCSCTCCVPILYGKDLMLSGKEGVLNLRRMRFGGKWLVLWRQKRLL